MKRHLAIITSLLLQTLLLTGCLSMSSTTIGMDEKEWLRSTIIADPVYMDGQVTAFRSGGMYYYFLNKKLVKVDQGVLPAQTIRLEIR
jgi:hypothetical protein